MVTVSVNASFVGVPFTSAWLESVEVHAEVNVSRLNPKSFVTPVSLSVYFK